MLSLIVPCYNEQEVLLLFYSTVCKILDEINRSYEILFIDDGSTDDTLMLIKGVASKNPNVRYFSFSRNFGKESAIYAGFCYAKGDYIVVMDADMQDPPSLLPQMIDILDSGDYDSVATRRTTRKGEPVLRSFFARQFYKIINAISDADVVDGARDFRMMKKEMADAIVRMGEYNRFSKGIFGWIGYRTYWLAYENVERAAGQTKWSFWKLTKYAVDGIINFSQAPLSIASWFGVLMTFVSFIFLIAIVIRKILFGDPVMGWASTICVIILIGGIQMLSLGIMGQYIAKMYMEIKHRPHFIIRETNEEIQNKME